MQKLVSIYLDIASMTPDRKGFGIVLSYQEFHGRAEEHLSEYLDAGWKVVHLQTMPVSAVGGWVVVTIEKDD